MADLASLTIVRANRDQIVQYRKVNSEQWGHGAPEDYYVEMWDRVDQLETGAEGKVTIWLLMKRENVDSLDFLSGCMTLRRDGLIRAIRTNDAGEDEVEVRQAPNYSIATVYTPKQHRQKGYGKHMMRLLHWVLAPESVLPHSSFPTQSWGAPPERVAEVADAVFSTLYSAIGPDFYTKCGPFPGDDSTGWIIKDPKSTAWDVEKVLKGVEIKKDSEEWKWVDEDEVKKLLDLDTDVIKEEIARPIDLGKDWEVTCFPNKGVAMFFNELLRPMWMQMDPAPIHWGICCASPDVNMLDVRTMATWILVPYKKAMTISRLRSTPENFEALLRQIAVYAKIHGIENIEVWNLPEDLAEIGRRMGGETFDRQDERLPSIKWYGTEQIKWIHNEAFSNC